MLNILNRLSPFFEDCYRRIGVREYARMMKMSPPSASTLLKGFRGMGLLKMEKDRGYNFYYARRESKDFVDLSRMYWRRKLDTMVSEISKRYLDPAVVLFGSLSKAEAKTDSDIDLAVFSSTMMKGSRPMSRKNMESRLKRSIQIVEFRSLKSIKDVDFAESVANGYVLAGRLEL